MSQVEWQQVKEIFYQALSSPPASRSEFLDSACGDDHALRSQVEVLLGSYDSEFLESPILQGVSSKPKFEPGHTFSHYTILKLLGRGGMGEVYLANDTALDRMTAIKVIHSESGFGDQAARRLLREARSAAKLDHPNICSVYEVGETGGQPFIAMQYVEGDLLESLIAAGPVPFRRALLIARQIAAALIKAHSWGIVHRDIKPSNIIIGQGDHAKVLDFGLAKETLVAPNNSELSAVGMVAGTVTYMSPEHVRAQEINGQADVWSLGVVLYQMLTGRTPFGGESKADLIAEILHNDFAPVTSIIPGLPASTDYVLSRALRKDRSSRYETIEEFDADLVQLADAGTVNVRRGYEAEKSKQAAVSKSRLSIAFVVGSVLLLVVTAAIGLGIWQNRGASDKERLFAPDAVQLSSIYNVKRQPGGMIAGIVFSPDSKAIAYGMRDGEFSSVYVQQISGEEPIRLSDGPASTWSPVWSPDGTRIAYLGIVDDRVAVMSTTPTGGEHKRLVDLGRRTMAGHVLSKWSNDGTRIYFDDGITGPRSVDLASGVISQIDVSGIEGKLISGFSLTHDETRLIMRSDFEDRERIWVKDLNNVGARLIDDPFSSGGTPTWFPDNETFAYSSDRDGMYQIYIRSIDGTFSRPVTFGNFNSSQPIVSPDGQRIAYLTNLDEANVFATDITSRKERAITSNVNLQLFPSLSPDGSTVAYGTMSDSRKIYIANLKIDTLNAGPSVNINEAGCCPVWSPDGTEVALFKMVGTKGNINKYSIRDKTVSALTTVGLEGADLSLAPYDHRSKHFEWSPDSTRMIFGSLSSGISNVWTVNRDGSDERMVTDLKDRTFYVHSPMWSPKGDRIAFLHSGSRKVPEERISIIENGETRIVAQFGSRVRLLSWSKTLNGVYVAVGDLDTGSRLKEQIVYFIFADGSDRVQTVARLPKTRHYGVSISPDEKWIAFSQLTGGIDDLYIVPVHGGEPMRITSNAESTLFYSGVSWAPDSQTLLYSKQTGGMQISLISHK